MKRVLQRLLGRGPRVSTTTVAVQPGELPENILPFGTPLNSSALAVFAHDPDIPDDRFRGDGLHGDELNGVLATMMVKLDAPEEFSDNESVRGKNDKHKEHDSYHGNRGGSCHGSPNSYDGDESTVSSRHYSNTMATLNNNIIPPPAKDDRDRKSHISRFANETTAHGFWHVFPPGYTAGCAGWTVQRAVWAALFAWGVAMFLYMKIVHIQMYFSFPHSTIIDEGAFHTDRFPAITICNLNKYRLSRLRNSDFWHIGQSLRYLDASRSLRPEPLINRTLPKPVPAYTDPQNFAVLSNLSDFPASWRENPPPFCLLDAQDRAGHQLEDTVLDCHYRGKKCCKDWFKPVFTRYGKCYTFNSGTPNQPVLKTLKGGIGNGVEFFLDVQQDDYMPAWGESDEVTFEVGFKIQLHTQEEPPFIHELGFGVGPGMQYYVSTQEQRITYLPAPWGQCKAENDLTFDFAKYTTSACRIDCETKFVVSQCGCKMVHMPGSFPICTPDVYVECADQALDFLVKSDNKKCVCDTPCNTTRYNLFMSHVKFPSEQAVKYLARKYAKREDYFRKNTLVMNIFFEALNYETIEQQKAYEVASLLGDIGGQMGLFIGASILTILELFDYLYEVLKDKCTERRHQPRSESNAVSVNLEDCKRDNSRAPLS
ncbi:acid-sensing ion channel 1-like isoform X1 [Branchiostoma lanceolatum]|uniref:acid-sensing ion channel 1-like isoform X1 n=1 Tax=Branchiostoma lanceolatum TaxID=7740 RepID=UPI00345546ED